MDKFLYMIVQRAALSETIGTEETRIPNLARQGSTVHMGKEVM